jgi:hypothetical protein
MNTNFSPQPLVAESTSVEVMKLNNREAKVLGLLNTCASAYLFEEQKC